jgi:hypothetical protein
VSPSPTIARIRFVAGLQEVVAPFDDERIVVLNPGWVPDVPLQRQTLGILSAFGPILEEHDLFAESLDLIDTWAADAKLADRLLLEGVPYWYRIRETMWHWVHERLLWRYALGKLGASDGETPVVAPLREAALIDVVEAQGSPLELVGPPKERPTLRARVVGLFPTAFRQSYRRARPHTDTLRLEREKELQRAREALLLARVERVVAPGRSNILVLSAPSSYQRIGSAADRVPRDAYLSSVLSALRATDFVPTVVGCGIGRDSIERWWPMLGSNEHLLADFSIRSRWGRPDDVVRARAEADRALRTLEDLAAIPFRLDGLDFIRPFLQALRETSERIVLTDSLDLASIQRMVADVRPRAMLMTHEGNRTPWLIVAKRERIPTFAVQHGVLYATHPGYPDRRDPRQVLPTCTFVYGDFERRVLEASGYERGEVAVSGSPRVDLDDHPTDPDAETERAALRDDLGVAPGDRLLVVSTGYLLFMRRAHLAHMLARLFGGPLPGVHVVFKQHPVEVDEGPYRGVMTGLAQAGGYEPPRMSVVKDIDLYRLLRAADAHLGQGSTVLTDAVAVGTCNLIAQVGRSTAPLNYVEAGVAWPVRDHADLRDAMESLPTPTDEARQMFLDEHFNGLGHDAGGRIAAAIARSLASPSVHPVQPGGAS